MIPEDKLRSLVSEGHINVVESTLVCNPVATYDRAKEPATQYMQRTIQAAIDVRASRKHIQPLSLG
jgi:hypothetical protein